MGVASAGDQRRRVALVLDGRGWPGVALVRSLGAAGWFVVAPSGTRSARSPYAAASVRIPSPTRDVRGFVEAVRSAIAQYRVDVVAPAEDASLELVYETDGLLGDTHVLGGSAESAALAWDKLRTLEAAERVGFGVPPYVVPDSLDDVAAAARAVGLPCVVKPRRSYAQRANRLRKRRHVIARSEDQARAAAEQFVAAGFGMPIVQAWVPGTPIGVIAVLRNRRVLAYAGRLGISYYPVTGGSTVRRRTVPASEPGVQEALALLRDIGFEGMGDVQMQVDATGTPRLMEIGARTVGWLPLAIAAGADVPLIAARALYGDEPPETIVARPGVDMRWLADDLRRVAVLLTPRVDLPPGARRRDLLMQSWPPFGRGIHYDGPA